jgi:drug/metabolite transporter, DME family
MNIQTIGASQVLLAGILWGTSGTVASFFPAVASPLAIGAVRITVGGLSLLLFLIVSRRGRPFRLKGPIPIHLVLISALGMAITQVTLFLSIRLAGVTVATMIFIGSSPLISGLISIVVRKEKQTVSWLISSLVVALGCIGMALSESLTNSSPAIESTLLQGAIAALIAGLGWAVEGHCIKQLQKNATPLEASTIVMLSGAVLLLPMAATTDFTWVTYEGSIILIIALGIATAAVPYLFFSLGMKHIPVSHAFLYGLTEPITASFLGLLLLHEKLNQAGIIGYSLIIFGLLLFSYWELKASSPVKTVAPGYPN